MSSVFQRMLAIYDYMLKSSVKVDAQEYFQFGVPRDYTEVTIWRGNVEQIATALNLKHPTVAQTMVRLHHVECIRMVKRGAAGYPSIYLILYRPTEADYAAALERSSVTGKFQPATAAQRAQDAINRLTARVSELEQRIARLELVQKNDALRYSSRRNGDSTESSG